MSNSFSGSGSLSGSGFFSAISNAFALLATKIIGYTNTLISGGSSYYTTRIEATVDTLIAYGYNIMWKSSNRGKNWEVVPSNFSAKDGLYAYNKYYAISPYYNPVLTAGLISSNSYSGFASDWTSVTIPNLTQNDSPFRLFSHSNNGITTLSYYSYNNATAVTKLWTTTDGNSWSEEVIPVEGNFEIISKNGKTFYIKSNIVNGSIISYTFITKLNGTFISDTKSLPCELFRIYGDNLYAFTNSGNQSAVYSVVKIRPDLTTVTDSVQNINEYGQNGYIRAMIPFGNEEVCLIATITEGSNTHVYRSINYGQTWTKTTFADVMTNSGFLTSDNDDTLVFIDTASAASITSTDYGQVWTFEFISNPNNLYYSFPYAPTHSIAFKTLVETQVSIGNQGEVGAEVLAPVDVYTVPPIKTTSIDQVTIKNNSANTITYDLGVLDSGVELTDQNALINDQAISAGATATITSITTPMTTGQKITVFPSAVDVVEVKVYGTES